MQTFLPYPDFQRSMICLDPSRLGNQVYREGMTLLRGGWPNHPAAKMWRGYEQALAMYLLCGVEELLARGKDYRDRPWCQELLNTVPIQPINNFEMWLRSSRAIMRLAPMPPWLGDDKLHASHRSALLYKDRAWYSQFKWKEKPLGPSPITGKLQYVWPVT